MPFARAQGRKISILHNRREGRRVRQLRLHVFDSFADAAEILASRERWELLCESIEANLGDELFVDRDLLAGKVRAILERVPKKTEANSLQAKIAGLIETLRYLERPLTPSQLRSLRAAWDDLDELRQVIGNTLELIEKKKEDNTMQTDMTDNRDAVSAETLFEQGLAHYDRGEWDQAKKRFVQGVTVDPEHVDLLVHAGLSELLENNLDLALARFDRAAKLGRREADRLIASDPDEYVKFEDFDAWLAKRTCELADECPDADTEACDDCDHHPRMGWIGLYSHWELRPFFRALGNKAITLMRMKRYREAIDILLLARSYDERVGQRNMIGECHLCLGNLEEASHWYCEMLWPEAYYEKAFVLTRLGREEEALRHLLTGITQNWHIARMLIGDDKPETIRYVGEALPNRLEASEFIHEHAHLFKGQTRFRAMVRCILDDAEIDELLTEFAEARTRREEERECQMDRARWDLIFGEMNHEFLDRHVPRLLDNLSDPSGDYWMPRENDVVTVTVEEKKQLNWLAELADAPGKTIYFRPGSYPEHVSEGDTVRILVTKSWHYKRRLFVAGEVERE
jgi:tetratricopeptide (TPR) repeat protein